MSFQLDEWDGVLVVTVLTEATVEHTSEIFEEALRRCREDQLALVLDFSRTDFLSSSLMGQILALKGSVEKADLPMGLVNPNSMMRRYLEITGLAVHFRVFDDLTEALSAMRESD